MEELREMAQEKNLSGYSSMSKDELVDALTEEYSREEVEEWTDSNGEVETSALKTIERKFHENVLPIAVLICVGAVVMGLGLNYVGAGRNGSKGSDSMEYKTFTDENLGFSFSYPSGWNVVYRPSVSRYFIRDNTSEAGSQTVGEIWGYGVENLNRENRIFEINEFLKSRYENMENFSFYRGPDLRVDEGEIEYTLVRTGDFEYQGENFDKLYYVHLKKLGEKERYFSFIGQKYGNMGGIGFTEGEYEKYREPLDHLIDSFELLENYGLENE